MPEQPPGPETYLPEEIDTTGCIVCEHPAREVIEQYLFIGYGYHEIPRQIGEPFEFKDQIRSHHFQRHIKAVSRESYLFMIVTYMQDARKLQQRELEKGPRGQQRIIHMTDNGRKWAITKIGQMEGYDKPGKVAPGVKGLLEKLVSEQPHLVDRVKTIAGPKPKEEE